MLQIRPAHARLARRRRARAYARTIRARPRTGLRAALLATAIASAAAACGSTPAPGRGTAEPGDLLVVDADAGPPLADGEHLGVIFLARPRAAGAAAPDGAGSAANPAAAGEAGGAGTLELTVFAQDPRWFEPVDVLPLPDGCALVLEQHWSPDGGAAHGALFRACGSGGPVTLLWSDPRARQVVAMAYSERDGTLYVSDREADPQGLGTNTGCVFAIPLRADATAGQTRIAAAGPELVTPGALVVLHDNRLLLMDADANPHHVLLPDGRAATPGVLYEVREGGLTTLLVPEQTVSPIALIERLHAPRADAPELFLVDANEGTEHGVVGDGAVFRVDLDAARPALHKLVDSVMLKRARALVDPAGGDTLADGRLVLADANADPLKLGEDGTKKGVYGTGHGALLVVDPDAGTVETLLASERFVTPVVVRRVKR